jgi:hypothetical protein
MATTYVPELRDETLAVDDAVPRVVGWIGAVALLALLATAMVLGASQLVSAMGETLEADRTAAPQAVIRPGNGPSVAATQGARIVSRDCTLAGPVRVAPDGTGAFTVTSGAENVRCPDGDFRNGFTLRWPPDDPVQTQPLRG